MGQASLLLATKQWQKESACNINNICALNPIYLPAFEINAKIKEAVTNEDGRDMSPAPIIHDSKKEMRLAYKLILLYFMILGVTSCSSINPVRFAAIGDTPYHESDSELALLSETLESIAKKDIPFIVHVGDIFRGRTSCSPELYELRANVFHQSPIPFLVTIGDNEFNDCPDPQEAQYLFRKIILGNPPIRHEVMGKNNNIGPVHVTRQAEMIENVTWSYQNIDFIMFVLPQLPGDYPLSNEHISNMLDNNTTFIQERFNQAKQNQRDAIVMISHSDSFLCKLSVCATFNTMLEDEVNNFAKPTLWINGSNHNRTFMDGGYQELPHWWHLRPGSTPEEHWPEISFSPKTKRFSIKWLVGPAGEKE
jgi:hypothetical protein